MENIVTSLKIRCAKAGISLSKLCNEAGIDRSVVERWKKEEPKTLQTLRKLESTLQEKYNV